MLETMEDAGGTGLAAPQVHVPLRLVVFFVAGRRAAQEDGPPEDGPPEDYSLAGGRRDVPLTVLVNPEIEPLTEATVLGPEACLSVPGLVGQVPRFTRIRYRGLTLEGAPLEREARSEEHTSELKSLMRISYAVFCLKKKSYINERHITHLTSH